MALTLDEILRQVSLFNSAPPQGGVQVGQATDTSVISAEQQAKDIALQKILDGIQAGQGAVPKTPPVQGQPPAFTPQPPYDQSQNALVGALASLAGGGLNVANSAPQATTKAPLVNPLDMVNPVVPVKPVIVPVEKAAVKDPRVEALNKGFLEDQYRPSEIAKAAGASDRTIQAQRQPNGTILFTNVGTKTWSEMDAEKSKQVGNTILGTTGVTPETQFTVGNIKKVKESLLNERDPSVIAKSVSELKTSATNFLNKMTADEIGKQEMILGLPQMQMELAQARALDQKIAATNPAGAINARNVLVKMEQVRSTAEKSAESALAVNMTFVSVKSELDSFDKDLLIQTAMGSMGEGLKNKFEAEDTANALNPTEKSNAVLVWPDLADKDGNPDYNALGSRLKRIKPAEAAVLRFTPYEAAQVAIADPTNTTATALFKNSLIKDGMNEEEATNRVAVAQGMVKDLAKFKIAYNAIVPKANRVEGDSLLQPDVSKKETVIQEDNLQKARIVREYMALEATRDFTRKADDWLGLFAQDDPDLAKAISDVKASGKDPSVSNIASLYIQGTAEEQQTKRLALQSILTKSIQAKKPSVLGALKLDQALNEIPALAGPDPWYAQIAKLGNGTDPLAMLRREPGKIF